MRVRVALPFPLVAEVASAEVAELEIHRSAGVWAIVKAAEITTYAA